MSANPDKQAREAIYADLIRFLHEDAPAEEFLAQMARAEALPGGAEQKSALIDGIRMAMAIRNRLELQQKREQGLLSVIESAQSLSGHLDLMELLHAIVSRARNLLGSHVAWISVYNPEANEMQVQVSDGAIFKDTDTMTTQKPFGVGGVIFTTGQPFSTSDYLSDDRFRHDPKLDRIFENEGICCLVGVPLITENEVTGLLFVADRYQRSHTALEISILSTLATHAAVAFKTAKLFDVTNTALKNADMAREELERRVSDIDAAAEAHEQLTSQLAQGASLAMLCATVAQLLDGDVLVVDEALQIISQGANGQREQALDLHDEKVNLIEMAMRESRRVGRSVIAYPDKDNICRVISVIAGDDVVGAVLLFRQADLDEIPLRTFERSASVIGIVLLSQDRIEIHKSRNVAALLRGLLSPHEYEWSSTLARANQFQLDMSQPLSLLIVECDDLKASYVAKRLRALTSLSGVVLDEIDNVVAFVCSTQAAPDIVQTCSKLFDNELNTHYWGILSRPAATAEELPSLYTSLRRALLVAKRLRVNGILNQNEMAMYSTLFETHDRTSLDEFLQATLGKLFAHDKKNSAELTRTLLCYFDANSNASLVAKRLNIHVNTVRQRLASIERLVGHLGNPTRALEIHIALRLSVLIR